MHGWGSRAPVPVLALRPASLSIPQAERDSHHNLVNAQRAGQGAPSNLLRQIPIQPASGLNSSLSATLAGRVNFAALLLCLVFVVVSHSHAPSAAFRLVLVRTSDDRRSKKGSKKEGKKQSGFAG